MEWIKGFAKGFATTLKILFRKPVTEQYPEYKRPLPARSRAVIILTRTRTERNGAWLLPLLSRLPGELYFHAIGRTERWPSLPRWFRINFARCIYCGFCEEACPTLAIQLTPHFETSRRDVLKLVYEKEDLLVDHGGKNREYNFYRHAGVTMVGNKERISTNQNRST